MKSSLVSTDTTAAVYPFKFDARTDASPPVKTSGDVRNDAMVEWLSQQQPRRDQRTLGWGSLAHGAAAVLFSFYGGECLAAELESEDIFLRIVNRCDLSQPIFEFDEIQIGENCDLGVQSSSSDNVIGPGSFPDRVRLSDDCTRFADWENTDDELEWDPANYTARLAVEEFYGPEDAYPQSS